MLLQKSELIACALIILFASLGLATPLAVADSPSGKSGILIPRDLVIQEPFGATIHHVFKSVSRDQAKAFQLARAYNLQWIRVGFQRRVIQPHPNILQWNIMDFTIESARNAGVNILGLLEYNVGWASTAPNTFQSESYIFMPQIESWKSYVRDLVGHYKESVTYWEVWNEPDIAPFWKPEPNPRDYFRLLQATYEAAKQGNPNCRILGFSTTSPPSGFTEAVLRMGGAQFCDIISYHSYCPYVKEGAPPENYLLSVLAELDALIRKYNGGNKKPIWITEIGYNLNPAVLRLVNKEQQANYLQRVYLLALGSGIVQGVLWHELIEGSPGKGEDYGILEKMDNPYPAALALKNLIEQLGASPHLLGELSFSDRDLYGYVFEKDGKRILALWCAFGSQKLELNFGDAKTSGTPRDGIQTYPAATDSRGTFSVLLNEAPIFLQTNASLDQINSSLISITNTTANFSAPAYGILIGSKNDQSYLFGDWQSPEVSNPPAGPDLRHLFANCRWSGADSGIRFPIDPRKRYLFQLSYFANPSLPSQKKEIYINGKYFNTLKASGWNLFESVVDSSFWNNQDIAYITFKVDRKSVV